MHAKVVLTLHPGMHHKRKLDRSFFPWIERRPTDGCEGRSAALQHFDPRHAVKSKLGIAHVLDAEYGLDSFAQLDIAIIEHHLVDGSGAQ